MSATKRFDLRTVLSVTTGRLLTKSKGPRDNGIGDMYEFLNWMAGDSAFTHQLGRFAKECKPWLYRWFPDLQKAENALPELDDHILVSGPEAGCEAWINWLIGSLGLPESFEIGKIPMDDHEHKDPVAELVEMRGSDKGIIVVEEGGGQS